MKQFGFSDTVVFYATNFGLRVFESMDDFEDYGGADINSIVCRLDDLKEIALCWHNGKEHRLDESNTRRAFSLLQNLALDTFEESDL